MTTGLAQASDFVRADIAAPRGNGLWSVAGRVTAQVFYITVTLFLFANLQDRTETITVALIGLVFASLRASTLSGACAQQRVAFLLETEIKNVRQTMTQELGPPPTSDAEIDQSLEALTKLLRIDYAGLTVIGAICLYHLGIAILYGAAYQELLGLH